MEIKEVYLQGQEEAYGYNNPNKIIIHHPEWHGDIQGLNDLMRGMDYYMIGYNYYVRMDGTVWKGRPDNVTGANCYGQNNCSLGVCFEGNFEVDTMPEVQFNSGVELIKYLKEKDNISEVGGHKKYFNTACPGKNFPLDRMLDAVNGTVINKQVASKPINNDGGFKEMDKVYKNGSTPEPVYQTEACNNQIGSLDPWELANAIGDVNGKIIVLYNTNSGKKVGFVKYRAGL
ncbi:peptidoglycan recognition protein family protein [Inconstantimicrobium mannanitabidum]|uniref:Uncharacterized protein n=1 Tax=Inconstantimicrobium mannanitabidum TaxID=1604901 RepID=A0ACB5R9E1_9CLOT|nr:peptidoglycan recognition family protein [Clostridium sp. TW13]GKX65657.1 hypothetical protein rsdtw13_09150 [Clostridium sp. TW13]